LTVVISDRIIQEVRQRTDIVEFVSGYVSLRKAGRNYVGLCPFHKEKTPSFTVSPEKQIFYCFGCGVGGDVVSFYMKINGASFPEAVRFLAEKCGIAVKESLPGRGGGGIKEKLWALNRAAADFFSQALFSPQGEVARKYIENRGITPEVIRQLKLGYAPEEWHWLGEKLKKLGYDLALAEQAGLIIPREKGGYYDRFRGRVIFPIHDEMGRIVAFGGRDLKDGLPKYLNSPETPIYVKGRSLYGLSFARNGIREKGEVVVVEGYFDFLTLWTFGVSNVVATLGTALTEEHVSLIRRYASCAILVFDPDEAGRKALARSLPLFLKQHLEMKVVVLPEGYDPDLFVRRFGRERWEEEMQKARPAVEYYIDEMLHPAQGVQQEREIMAEALRFIKEIPQSAERHLFIRRLAQRLNVDEAILAREVSDTPETAAKRLPQGPRTDLLELKLIYLMLEEERFVKRVAKSNLLEFFPHEDLKKLASLMLERVQKGEGVDRAWFLSQMEGERKRHLFNWMMVMDMSKDEREREFEDTVRRIKEKWYQRASRNLNLQIRQAQERGDEELCRHLLVKKAQLLEEEKAIRKLTVN